ncbi:carbohydrate sulfotransferase 1-like [Lytechinus pictus]|uniref:carbohydrate sulfotransferase 1-like n=1 Tax=Lytechinus pictus TaxID=7653 RepID=UPI0030B9C4E9
MPTFAVAKEVLNSGQLYGFSRAISNDDFNDSFKDGSIFEYRGNKLGDSKESHPKKHIKNDTLVDVIEISREGIISRENSSEEYHLQNFQNTEGIHRLPLKMIETPSPTASPQRGQIIIVTTKRSGSSFVGELFNSNPDIFYMYEPLLHVTFDVLNHRVKNEQADAVMLSVWNRTLRCNYLSSSQGPDNWLRRGGCKTCQVSEALNRSKLICPEPTIPRIEVGSIISKLCSDHTYTVLKTIRVNDIKDLRSFLEDPSLNLKIIHLVRDPRAVINSRRKLKEPNYDLKRRKGPHADEITDLCEHMARNLQYNDEQPSWLKRKYMLVRFEDVAKNPLDEIQRMYQHLGMKIHPNVLSWVKNNTHSVSEADRPFSRTRDSDKVINAWKNSIPETIRKEVEGKCSHVMNSLSYLPVV